MSKSREIRIKQIQKAIAEGAKSLIEIAEIIGLKPTTLYECYRKELGEYNKLPRGMVVANPRKDPFKDELILEGLTLQRTVEVYKEGTNHRLSRERMRQYIAWTGQQKLWEEKKQERKRVFSDLAYQINVIGQTLASQIFSSQNVSDEEREAYYYAVEYSKTRESQGNRFNFERVYNVFKVYCSAKKRGERLSLKEIGELSATEPSQVRYILKRVGLEALYGTKRRRNNLTPEEQKVLERAVDTKFSYGNIAYFLELNSWNVYQFFNRNKNLKQRRPFAETTVQICDKTRDPEKITFSLASRVYEAVDAGFSREEIIDSYLKHQGSYDYIMQHRQKIEPEIIQGLNLMFPEREINKPYRTWKV